MFKNIFCYFIWINILDWVMLYKFCYENKVIIFLKFLLVFLLVRKQPKTLSFLGYIVTFIDFCKNDWISILFIGKFYTNYCWKIYGVFKFIFTSYHIYKKIRLKNDTFILDLIGCCNYYNITIDSFLNLELDVLCFMKYKNFKFHLFLYKFFVKNAVNKK